MEGYRMMFLMSSVEIEKTEPGAAPGKSWVELLTNNRNS